MTRRHLGAAYIVRVRTRPQSLDVADLFLAGGLLVVALCEIWVPFSSVQGDGSRVATSVITVPVCAVLALRRRRPLLTALVALLTWPAADIVLPLLVLFYGQFVPMAVALFSAARHGRGRTPYVAAAAAGVALLYFDLRVDVLQAPGEIFFHWGVMVLVWSAGTALRVMERRALVSTQRAIDAEVTAAAQVMAAVLDERTRIARELHDVVAHSLGVIVVQAGSAALVVDEDPAYVGDALETIRATGTEAMAEMRRVVAMLRDRDESGSLHPQPGVSSLPTLVDHVRSTGLVVELSLDGEPRALPPGLDLAVYRIVQEALTNVGRHAEASSAHVRLRYREDALEVEIADDGRGPTAGGSEPGHGLIGMRERVALYGGRLEVGRLGTTGFMVRAMLPVGAA